MRNRYDEQLSALRDAGLWRTHHVRETPQSRFVEYQGQRYLNFNSNDYLGLSADPRLMQAAIEGMQAYGLGSGAANTLSGYTVAHEKLCHTLAQWLGREKVLLFSSGYQANMAMLTGLIQSSDFIYSDRNNHASLVDGMRMTGAKFKRYKDISKYDLINPLAGAKHGSTEPLVGAKHLSPSSLFIVSESIFSMEGNAADLTSLNTIANKNDATLLVDEAHAFGLYGNEGQGSVAQAGLSQNEVPVIMGTFGKALGLSGAMLAGRAQEIDIIMQSARSYLFTTALSPMIAAAATRSVECVMSMHAEREHLFSLIRVFREKAASLDLNLLDSHSPIQSLLFNSIEHTQQYGDALKAKCIWAPVIRYPTVPLESPRLRFTLTALHTHEDIDTLFTAIQEVRDAFQF